MINFIHSIADDRVYLKIIVDPLSPSSIEVSFIGPSADIEPLREKYKIGLSDWDLNLDVYKNLLRIFGNYVHFSIIFRF